MRWRSFLVLLAGAILLSVVAMALWPEVKREMPQTAEQVNWLASQAAQAYQGIPGGVKLAAAVLICVGGFYFGMTYFLVSYKGIKRF